MPTNNDFSFYVGEDYTQPFTIYQSDGVTVQDITGWTITLSMRKYTDYNFPILLTITLSIISGTAGTCQAAFVRADTSSLEPRVYTFSLDRTDTGSDTALDVAYLNLKARSR